VLCVVPIPARSPSYEEEGYKLPKLLIPAHGEPMFAAAVHSLPRADRYVAIVPEEFERRFSITTLAQRHIPGCEVVFVDVPEASPARLCLEAAVHVTTGEPLLVSTGDFHMAGDGGAFERLMGEGIYDGIVWTFQMRSTVKKPLNSLAFCRVADGSVTEVSIGAPISDTPHLDPALVGAYAFRDGADFLAHAAQVLDSAPAIPDGGGFPACIEAYLAAGRRVAPLPVQTFVPFRDPFDLQLYEAWEEYFYAETTHPYQGRPRESP
jgi:hypothetical protein